MQELSSYSQYLEFIAIVIGFLRYKEIKDFKFKYVLFFLIYVLITEIFAGVCYDLFGFVNTPVYNVYVLVNFAFFIAWYHSVLKSLIRKRIIKILFFVYVSFWLIDAVFLEQFLVDYLTYSFSLGTLFLIISVSFYFVEMLNREVVMHITKSPYFWVSFGILVYCVTFLPFYITYLFFLQENPIILSIVLFLINCIQYCCFAIAFVRADRFTIEHPVDNNSL
ncbi:hypothetical protein DSM03_10775 [Leeuwenhoekiella aestuarii]|uniref:Uncharacterized protein n=1 Tax=Leeuwenhoekiella aestuarii TaxID=2249426 RepID=A0A4Q0NPF6_9FLAO|nr:hypothetical protein [Leeuwenhoekiella aestuarii]RXG11978.1 hypothetical protein DSM04_10875 [Leeuwenhoekiella aestuarii]RXG13536.1 hypothetical protein DSM03_10775 [Leeuwenhoekiella aestuarii]